MGAETASSICSLIRRWKVKTSFLLRTAAPARCRPRRFPWHLIARNRLWEGQRWGRPAQRIRPCESPRDGLPGGQQPGPRAVSLDRRAHLHRRHAAIAIALTRHVVPLRPVPGQGGPRRCAVGDNVTERRPSPVRAAAPQAPPCAAGHRRRASEAVHAGDAADACARRRTTELAAGKCGLGGSGGLGDSPSLLFFFSHAAPFPSLFASSLPACERTRESHLAHLSHLGIRNERVPGIA